MQTHRSFARILSAPLSVLIAHYALIAQLTRRSLATRYRGSLLGIGWSILHPLALLAAYTFVFHIVLDARWEQLPIERDSSGAVDFAIPLFAGLILFWWASECLQLGPLIVQQHANYVKKTVFPLPALPLPAFLVASLHMLISSSILITYLAATGSLAATFWAYPLILLALTPYLLGAMWLLGALGVYLKDLTHLVNLAVMLLMFLTPVFYPISIVPENWQAALMLNPLTYALEEARAALIWGHIPQPAALAQFFVIGWAFACAGYAVFTYLQKDFADVL